jgi:formamidase
VRCDVCGTEVKPFEIGRAPGVVQVTFLAPLSRLDAAGIGDLAREQYGL